MFTHALNFVQILKSMRLKTVVNSQQHAGMLTRAFKVFCYLGYTICIQFKGSAGGARANFHVDMNPFLGGGAKK